MEDNEKSEITSEENILEVFTPTAYRVVETERNAKTVTLRVYAQGDSSRVFYETDVVIDLEAFKPMTMLGDYWKEEQVCKACGKHPAYRDGECLDCCH